MNVFVLNVNARGGADGRPVPRWLRIIIFDYLAVICCVQRGPCPFINKRPRRDQHGNPETESNELRFKGCPNNHNTSGMPGPPAQYHPVQRESMMSNTGERNVRYSTTVVGTHYGENDVLLDERHDRMAEYESVSDRRLARLERSVEAILKFLKTGDKRKDKAARQKSDWATVAKVSDRVLLIVFVCTTATTSLVLMLQHSPEKPIPEKTIHDFTASQV